MNLLSDQSSWPEGDFAILSSVYGCPNTPVFEWKYIYMTFKHKPGITGFNTYSQQYHIQGAAKDHFVSLHFCLKYESKLAEGQNQTKWSEGNYCIFGINNGCPPGKLHICNNTNGKNRLRNGHLRNRVTLSRERQ